MVSLSLKLEINNPQAPVAPREGDTVDVIGDLDSRRIIRLVAMAVETDPMHGMM